jgi:hypothetical protein
MRPAAVANEQATLPARRPRLPVPLLLLAPALTIFLVFFVLPLGVLVVNSFHDYSRLTGIIPTFTLKNYVRILSDGFYLEIILRTLRLAFLTSCVTLIIGYPIALYLTVASARQRAWIILLILSPLLVSVGTASFSHLACRPRSRGTRRERSSPVLPTSCCRSWCWPLQRRCRRSIRRCRWRPRASVLDPGGSFGSSCFP